MKEKIDIITELKDALKSRNNPSDLKEIHIGVVQELEPVVVTIFEGSVILKEDEELFISEWFRFRCDIDKTLALSSDVPDKLGSSKYNYGEAEKISESHSYGGAPCRIPDAISYLADAIADTNTAVSKINGELLALKCVLKVGDFVTIGSLAQQDKYILLDKVL